MIIKRILFLYVFLCLLCRAEAQIDTTYIRPLGHRLSVRPFIAKAMLFMNHEFESGEETNYLPNDPPKIGLGVSFNNTIISFGYGYGFNFMTDKAYGKTQAIDFQFHNYGRKFVFDLYFQRYKGFYDDQNSKNIKLFPDMEIRQYGAYGHYVFNHKRYSYIAAFNQDEKQLKSTGSFLLGGGVYNTHIRSDSSFVYNGKNSFENFQFGISAGYAYTWVLGRYWDISASTTVGINFGGDKFSRFGRKIEVYPTVSPRVSAGYNRGSWSLGFSYVGNMVFPVMSDKETVNLHTGALQISFVKRFDLIPVIGNRADGLLKYF
ncbi:MAG TPA: hypothetical protein DIT04_07125 [Dysgonomonas sp.]|nr:hypothetical protein [Dysgonomonas sp.]